MKTVLIALMFLTSISAFALDEKKCTADIQKFCSTVKPGPGAIVKCLLGHESELSPECKAAGREIKKEMRGAQAACKADIEKFCKDEKPGKGRKIRCLKKHAAELSPECTAARSHVIELRN